MEREIKNGLSTARAIINHVKTSNRVNLVETEARDILKAYGLPMQIYKLATDIDEAVEAARQIGFPVAMKIVSPEIIHKTDAKGVKLNLNNQEDDASAFTEIMHNAKAYKATAEIYGVIVIPMEKQGTEVIIGMIDDSTFGPTIMFGLGGIFVEVLEDVSFRVAPLSTVDALEMVQEIKAFPVLQGIRGQEAADIKTITDMLANASRMAIENPEIKEIDLNPIFVFPKGASVIDARIILA